MSELKLFFKNKDEFELWLNKNHDTCDEFWVIFSKSKDIETIRYDEAVEVAACYGWVEIILKSIDSLTYMRKFKHRNPKGIWSENNKRLAEKLLDEGKMHESGIKAVEAAIKSGAWDRNTHFEITSNHKTEFEKMLQPYPSAYNYYSGLPLSHKKQYLRYYYYPKREETKANHFKKIIEMLEKKKGFI